MSLDVILTEEVYEANITHNLNNMAHAAGIYHHLWRPDEIDIEYARELIEPLEGALIKLKLAPEHFKKFNPENGWGDYEGLVAFVETYLHACNAHPSARVGVSR